MSNMESASQQSLNEHIKNVENHIKDLQKNNNNSTYLEEFNQVLKDELDTLKQNETVLQENLNELEKIEKCDLQNDSAELEEQIRSIEKCTSELKEKIENAKLLNAAEKQTLKMKYEEKKFEIAREYSEKIRTLSKELKERKLEHSRKEKELLDELVIERASKNIQLNDLRISLQNKILQLNNVLEHGKKDYKRLQKELAVLKREQQINSKVASKPTNVFTFNNENRFKHQEDSLTVSKNPYNDKVTYSSISHPEENKRNLAHFKNDFTIANFTPSQNQPCFATNKKPEQKENEEESDTLRRKPVMFVSNTSKNLHYAKRKM